MSVVMNGYCHICKIAYERDHPRCFVTVPRPLALNTVAIAGLNELALAFGRMGIQSAHMSIAPNFCVAFRVELQARTFKSVAMGTTLAIATDDAYVRIAHRQAHGIKGEE